MSSGTPRAPDGEDWPRNGTILEAAPAGEAEGVNWVVFKNGMFMPTMQAGVQVVWAASK